MNTLYGWKAYRSGAGMTIEAVDDQGNPRKVSNVASIAAEADGIIATTQAGDLYRLLPADVL